MNAGGTVEIARHGGRGWDDICGGFVQALLNKYIALLARGVHPTIISDSLALACDEACRLTETFRDSVNINDEIG